MDGPSPDPRTVHFGSNASTSRTIVEDASLDPFDPDANSTFWTDPLHEQVYVTWAFYNSCLTLFLAVFGTITNSMAAAIFVHRKMRSPINAMLVALCNIDTAVVLLAVPLIVLPGLNTFIQEPKIDQAVTYSIVSMYPLAMTAKTCSVWIFVLITFERYMAVCHPLKARDLFYTIPQACIAIAIVVVVSFAYNFVRFWEYKLLYSDEFQAHIPTFLLRENEMYYHAYYTGLYLITHFLIPFAVVIVMTIRIILTISAAKRDRKQMSRQETKEHRTAYMLVIVILVFVLTNTLPFVMNTIEAFNVDFFTDLKTKLLATIILDLSNTLVIINSATTIFIYYYFSTKFRVIFKAKYLAKRTIAESGITMMTSVESQESLNELFAPRPIAVLIRYFRNIGVMIISGSRRGQHSSATLRRGDSRHGHHSKASVRRKRSNLESVSHSRSNSQTLLKRLNSSPLSAPGLGPRKTSDKAIGPPETSDGGNHLVVAPPEAFETTGNHLVVPEASVDGGLNFTGPLVDALALVEENNLVAPLATFRDDLSCGLDSIENGKDDNPEGERNAAEEEDENANESSKMLVDANHFQAPANKPVTSRDAKSFLIAV